MMKKSVWIRATFVALLALGACSSEREETVARPSPGARTNADSAAAPVRVDAHESESLPAPGKAPKAETAPLVPTIGKLAPEIVGADIDGKPIKLSDSRGKVVMLDFWGNW